MFKDNDKVLGCSHKRRKTRKKQEKFEPIYFIPYIVQSVGPSTVKLIHQTTLVVEDLLITEVKFVFFITIITNYFHRKFHGDDIEWQQLIQAYKNKLETNTEEEEDDKINEDVLVEEDDHEDEEINKDVLVEEDEDELEDDKLDEKKARGRRKKSTKKETWKEVTKKSDITPESGDEVQIWWEGEKQWFKEQF